MKETVLGKITVAGELMEMAEASVITELEQELITAA